MKKCYPDRLLLTSQWEDPESVYKRNQGAGTTDITSIVRKKKRRGWGGGWHGFSPRAEKKKEGCDRPSL